jgi:hypothetical protein
MHDSSIGLSLYNLYFMFMIVHLHVGFLWNLVALQHPYKNTLFTHTKVIER